MRLIDADAFERSVMFNSNIIDMQDVIYALRDYPNYPTINTIPANILQIIRGEVSELERIYPIEVDSAYIKLNDVMDLLEKYIKDNKEIKTPHKAESEE